jgi:uncharacterized RmlC-like cupin family protein
MEDKVILVNPGEILYIGARRPRQPENTAGSPDHPIYFE